jgi:hypothetical protein
VSYENYELRPESFHNKGFERGREINFVRWKKNQREKKPTIYLSDKDYFVLDIELALALLPEGVIEQVLGECFFVHEKDDDPTAQVIGNDLIEGRHVITINTDSVNRLAQKEGLDYFDKFEEILLHEIAHVFAEKPDGREFGSNLVRHINDIGADIKKAEWLEVYYGKKKNLDQKAQYYRSEQERLKKDLEQGLIKRQEFCDYLDRLAEEGLRQIAIDRNIPLGVYNTRKELIELIYDDWLRHG